MRYRRKATWQMRLLLRCLNVRRGDHWSSDAEMSHYRRTRNARPYSFGALYRQIYKKDREVSLSFFLGAIHESPVFILFFGRFLSRPYEIKRCLLKNILAFYFALGKKNIPPTSLRGSLESEIIFFSCALQNSAMRSASGWDDISPVK